MPRSPNFNQINPNQAIAICTRQQAEQLVKYDHHVVEVNGRPGVMLTYEWMPLEEHPGPLILTVVFHQAEKHPRAPEAIQSIVAELHFQVRGQPRRAQNRERDARFADREASAHRRESLKTASRVRECGEMINPSEQECPCIIRAFLSL